MSGPVSNRAIVRDLVSSAVLALGIVAGQAAQVAWSDLAGTSLLAACVLLADALAARWDGLRFRPSIAAWILAMTFVATGGLALLRATGHTSSLLPIFGLGAWVVFFLPGSAGRRGDRAHGGAMCSRS